MFKFIILGAGLGIVALAVIINCNVNKEQKYEEKKDLRRRGINPKTRKRMK